MKRRSLAASILTARSGPLSHGTIRTFSPLTIESLTARTHHQARRPILSASTQRTRTRPATRHYVSVPASKLQFGQPVHETHPHLLGPGDLTPGITAQEYHNRRAALSKALPPGAVAVLPAAEIKWRSGAVFFPFRQESNFLYLTGFNEPEALAIIENNGSTRDNFLFHLLVRPKDPAAEQWAGPWSGLAAATDIFNADHAASIHEAANYLAPILRRASCMYTDDHKHPIIRAAQTLINKPPRPSPLQPLVNAQRVIKSAAEIANMRHAGRVSGRALTNAMRRAWTREKDLAAYLNHAFTADGCDGPAYVPVVAGGLRATMIHYVLSNASLHPDELVLVDAGGEYGTYIADITRTWPVGGRFTSAQRDLYEAVLRVQRLGVSLCRANAALSLDDIHRATETGLRAELTALGFEGLDKPCGLEKLFSHHVGHYVGLDVHDCPGYGRSVPLRAGHCVTIEPGVYVPDEAGFPNHFRGMGIRIEDSVCVDEEGPTVLTVEAVKEVVDMEALRE